MIAAGELLREVGYGALSTRRVAEQAGVPLSQIHYHFGSMRGLMLELLRYENERLLERQTILYGSDRPLSDKWEMACQYLEEDLASGYVRVLHEMMYAALSDEGLRAQVVEQLEGWRRLLADVADEAVARFGPIGPFSPGELGLLVGQSFLGLELLLLLDFGEAQKDGFAAIRKIGLLLKDLERKTSDG